MNRLRQPSDSDYDVLGVSPAATDEEIRNAFCRLIDEQGYKVGVPLRSQWGRAREIKDAYSRLGDPVKRQAYDRSLGRAPEPTPWAAVAEDAATDELVLHEIEREESAPIDEEPRPAPNHTGPRRELASVGTPVADVEESSYFHHRPPPPYLSPTFDDIEQPPARRWGMPTAAALSLGLVLLASWTWWSRQPYTSAPEPRVAADAGDSSQAGSDLADIWARARGSLANAPQPKAAPVDPPSSMEALGQPAAPQRTTADGAEEASDLAMSKTLDGQSVAQTAQAGVAQPAAPLTGADETPAIPTPPQAEPPAPVATAPPQPQTAPAVDAAPMRPVSSGKTVQSPARWLGGGPIDSDNRGGRYKGVVAVQVAIGSAGRVSNCAVVRGSGNADLDAMTCRLVRERARFSPALDGQGRPVESHAYTTVLWGNRKRR